MTSPTVLSHRVIYLRPRAVRMPPNSMALLALAELPIYVSNGIRTVSDVTERALHKLGKSVTSPCPHRCIAEVTSPTPSSDRAARQHVARRCAQHACSSTGCQASGGRPGASCPTREARVGHLENHTCRSAGHAGLVDPQACCAPAPYDSSKDGGKLPYGLGRSVTSLTVLRPR